MLAPTLAAPIVDPLWHALALIGARPAPAWTWRRLLDTPPDQCWFLRRVALLADCVPCPHPCGCGHVHRVEQIEPGDFCAIPQEEDCESAPVTRDELAVFELDVERFATVVAGVFAVRLKIAPIGDAFGTHRIGTRSDGQSTVFVSFPSTAADALRVAHTLVADAQGSFTLLVPTADVLSHAVSACLATHGAMCAALADCFAACGGDMCAPTAPLSLPPIPGTAANADRTETCDGNTWPHARPDRPKWSDVSLAMHLQRVVVRFGGTQASFDYRDIDGFTDRRGAKKPNRMWTMLRAFAARNGVLPLPTKTTDPVRVRTISDLDRVLGQFFGIQDSALERDLDARVVRTRFRVTFKT